MMKRFPSSVVSSLSASSHHFICLDYLFNIKRKPTIWNTKYSVIFHITNCSSFHSRSEKKNEFSEVCSEGKSSCSVDCEEECAICWETLPSCSAASLYYDSKKKACSHQFHEGCVRSMIQPWKCPLCRARFYIVSNGPPPRPPPRVGARFNCLFPPTITGHVQNIVQSYNSHRATLTSNNSARVLPIVVPIQRQLPSPNIQPTLRNNYYPEPLSVSYSLDVLQTSLPANVDPTRKEDYLSDVDFQEVFQMDRERFQNLAKWKRIEMKKAKLLF